MHYALHLAARAQGRTAENPAVGCVIMQGERVVGTGWTQSGGRPHAETQALASAGEHARGATAYVTLEPCAHHGHTPPCAQSLIDAGITRVIIACTDTDTRVAGRGIECLREAGCEVITGMCEAEALALNAGFFRRLEHELPDITVKIATSADEKITTGDPDNPWLTNATSRAYGHRLRAEHQAIVTGIGTVLADNPSLTCRLAGLEDASPIRVVIDRQGRIPHSSALVQSARNVPLWILTANPDTAALEALGAHCLTLPNHFTFTDAMQTLAQHGINRALIEGGQRLTSAALASGSTNSLYWFKAPHMVGKAGICALNEGTLQDITSQYAPSQQRLGSDTLIYCAFADH